MLGAATLIVLSAQAPTNGDCVISLLTNAKAVGPSITLGEVADLSCLSPSMAQRAADMPVAAFKRRQSEALLSGRRVVERARALIPALRPHLPLVDEDVAIRAVRPIRVGGASRGDVSCVELVEPAAPGQALIADMLVTADCASERPERPYRYDRAVKAVRATRALEAGDLIGAPPAFSVASLPVGQEMQVEASFGPVTVRRTVKTMQPGRTGRSVAVMTADGVVFSAPAPEPAQ